MQFPGLYATCPEVGLLTAFLHYLPDITSQEVPRGINTLLQVASIRTVLIPITVRQKVQGPSHFLYE